MQVKSHCRSCCGEDSTCGHLQLPETPKSHEIAQRVGPWSSGFTPDATGWHSLQPRTVKVEGPRVTALALEPGAVL